MTAVEWLESKIFGDEIFSLSKVLEQAKEMEKQQIIDAHGNQTKKSGGISNATYILTGEQYYNETFKKK
jgi:hypothetical protein